MIQGRIRICVKTSFPFLNHVSSQVVMFMQLATRSYFHWSSI